MPRKAKPSRHRAPYKSPPPKPHGRAALPRSHAEQQLGPTKDFPHAHSIAPTHFELREDGSIGTPASGTARSKHTPNAVLEAGAPNPDARRQTPAHRLIFSTEKIWLYHGNCLELLDAIAAKYPDGRFDAIFADPPYFLSNGGITCHAGKMVKWSAAR